MFVKGLAREAEAAEKNAVANRAQTFGDVWLARWWLVGRHRNHRKYIRVFDVNSIPGKLQLFVRDYFRKWFANTPRKT